MSRIPVLYEDNHLIVVVKPPNLLSQADETGDPDLLGELKEMIKIRDQKPGNVYLGLVHRLDRPVGGVMVFAKTSKAASRLSDAVRRRDFEKIYHTIVHGIPHEPVRVLKDWLLKDAATNTVRIVAPGTRDAKEAILEYRILQTSGKGHSLLEIRLHTGRPHQIRVQCAGMGHPIVADHKYGHSPAGSFHGYPLALWAVSLSFPHPVTKEWLTFQSSPPASAPWNVF